MSAKATLGITREFLDEDGNLTMPGPGLKLLDDLPGLEYRVFDEWIREIPPEHVDGCDMVISGGARWTARALEGNDQLIALLYTGVGYDHIDVEALTANGTLFCFAPDAVRRPMACTVMTFILALAMRLMAKDRITRQGRWAEQSEYRGEGLTGKTLGGIGLGNIGREVFVLAQPFGMRHLGCDPYIDPASVADVGIELVDLDTLMSESDFVTISVPLNANTRHLVGEQEIRKMKPSAYLINTSRGPTVDEQALTEALREKWIQGAALDVFEQGTSRSRQPAPEDGQRHRIAPRARPYGRVLSARLGGQSQSGRTDSAGGDTPLGRQHRRARKRCLQSEIQTVRSLILN